MHPALTHQEALHRSTAIASPVEYDVYLNLRKGPRYNGLVQVRFTLRDTEAIFLDFTGRTPLSLQVNNSLPLDLGKDATALYECPKLRLPAGQLVIGPNVVRVKFENDYSLKSVGLNTFTDSDGDQYVYTHTEPFHQNWVMPLFDQPDLKATCRYHLLHPEDWTAVSNTSPTQHHKLHAEYLGSHVAKSEFEKLVVAEFRESDFQGGSKSVSVFRRTRLLSTYLFCLVAGPFAKLELPADEQLRGMPMRFFCRRQRAESGLEKYRFMFEVLAKGILFFEDLFGVELPFAKWDFVMCPRYDCTAMEYPGCVTFNEEAVMSDAGDVPIASKTHTSSVILHELAHMWFGNLVTMAW